MGKKGVRRGKPQIDSTLQAMIDAHGPIPVPTPEQLAKAIPAQQMFNFEDVREGMIRGRQAWVLKVTAVQKELADLKKFGEEFGFVPSTAVDGKADGFQIVDPVKGKQKGKRRGPKPGAKAKAPKTAKGAAKTSKGGRTSGQEEKIAAYLEKHPGSLKTEIGSATGLTEIQISQVFARLKEMTTNDGGRPARYTLAKGYKGAG